LTCDLLADFPIFLFPLCEAKKEKVRLSVCVFSPYGDLTPLYIPLLSGSRSYRIGTWAFDSHEVYDVVMTGVSSTCIVRLFSHFFPFLLSTFVVAHGVWLAWDGYGLLFALGIGGKAGVCPDYTCINSSI
jgi:hypothetical protein